MASDVVASGAIEVRTSVAARQHSFRGPLWMRSLVAALCAGVLAGAAFAQPPPDAAGTGTGQPSSDAPQPAVHLPAGPADGDSADRPAGAPAPDSAKKGSAEKEKQAYAETLDPLYAILIGALGSSAYLLAVWVGLVGRDGDARNRILEHLQARPWLGGGAYIVCGGGVAMVFQLQEPKLVAVQAFILGCTWPAVVTNYLSARQSGLTEAEARSRDKAKEVLEETNKVDKATRTVPGSRTITDEESKLDRLGELLKDLE